MMEKQQFSPICCSSSVATGSRRRSELLSIIKNASCLSSSSAETGKGRSKSSSNRVRHGFHLVEGKSGHDMEDYLVAEYRYDQSHELGIFAIFDGHLGDSVPSYLKDNLFNNILKESIFWVNPKEAIKNAYRSTNKFILENTRQLGPGGSTAVTAIVVDGKDLWIANIGDSRAVLCERGSANQLLLIMNPMSNGKGFSNKAVLLPLFQGMFLASMANSQLLGHLVIKVSRHI